MLLLSGITNGNTLYAGTDALKDPDRYIHPWILSASPIQQSTAKPNGGICKPTFGTVELAIDMFAGNWPPPVSWPVVLYHVPGALADKEVVLSGSLHLSRIDLTSVQYDLYDSGPEVDMLEETADYDDNTVVLPRAFGQVTHVTPVRLPDDSVTGHQRYHMGHIIGTMHTDWHVYDDGVDICSNVGAASDNVFTLTVLPVGEVTLSGPGEITTLEGVIQWAADSGRLSLDWTEGYIIRDDMGNAILDDADAPILDGSYTSPALSVIDWSAAWIIRDSDDNPILDDGDYPILDGSYTSSASITLSAWVDSQTTVKDFCSEIAAWCRHLFYVRDDQLYLLEMGSTLAARTLGEKDYTTAAVTWPAPVSILRSEWDVRTAAEESIGKYVKTTTDEVYATTDYRYGSDQTETPYQSDRDDILEALEAIVAYTNSARCEITMRMNNDSPLPIVGEQITTTIGALTVIMTVRDIQLDFTAMTTTVLGDAVIS